MMCHPTTHPETAGDAPASSATHRWSLWHPVARNLLERRCSRCGAAERGSSESINADALARLDAVTEAYRRIVADLQAEIAAARAGLRRDGEP